MGIVHIGRARHCIEENRFGKDPLSAQEFGEHIRLTTLSQSYKAPMASSRLAGTQGSSWPVVNASVNQTSGRISATRFATTDSDWEPNFLPPGWLNTGSLAGSGGQARVWVVRRIKDDMLAVSKVPFTRITPWLNERRDQTRIRQIQEAKEARSHDCKRLRSIYADVITPEASRLTSIIEIFDVLPDHPCVDEDAYVFEYCEGGELWKLACSFYEKSTKTPEQFVWYLLDNLARAINYLHTGNITTYLSGEETKTEAVFGRTGIWSPVVHCDLKPENVLLKRNPQNPNGFPLVKLADFDMSCYYDAPRPVKAGTPGYYAPEYPMMTPAVDIWGLGAVIHYLMWERAPADHPELYRRTTTGREDAHKPYCTVEPIGTSGYSNHLELIVHQCLNMDAASRISAPKLAHAVLVDSEFRASASMSQEGALPKWAITYDTQERPVWARDRYDTWPEQPARSKDTTVSAWNDDTREDSKRRRSSQEDVWDIAYTCGGDSSEPCDEQTESEDWFKPSRLSDNEYREPYGINSIL
ncbi:MAG: hypothetical protein M1828_003264 [Chrysothrix sp. TS-e1954]|nr:MAG: hypothetical protein M1828_003264 [Chrysothrix sp. TS-e1954]